MSRTMAFVPESDDAPSATPRPAAGAPSAAQGPTAAPPARRKALNATMAFGDPNAELQRAAKKMIEEAEQNVAAQNEAAAAGQAPVKDQGGPNQTVAFGAVEPDEAKRASPERHRTAAFGAVPPSAPTRPEPSPTGEPPRAASRRRKGLSATIAFGESPAELEKAIEQAEARASQQGKTQAFEAVSSRKTPVPPGPGQRRTPVPPGPGAVPAGPQPSAPAAAARRPRTGLTSTVAFEAPSEILDAARAAADAKEAAAAPAPVAKKSGLASTLAFEAPSEIAAREAAARAEAAGPPDESDLVKTLAYEPNEDIAKAQQAAGALDRVPARRPADAPQRSRTMIGGMGVLPAKGAKSPAASPPAGPAAGAPGAAPAATALGLGHEQMQDGVREAMGEAAASPPLAPTGAPVFDAAAAVGGDAPAPTADAAGYPAAPAGGYPAAPQPLQGQVAPDEAMNQAMAPPGPQGGPPAPQGQAATPTLAPPKRNTGMVVGIVVGVIVLLLVVILALWSFVT